MQQLVNDSPPLLEIENNAYFTRVQLAEDSHRQRPSGLELQTPFQPSLKETYQQQQQQQQQHYPHIQHHPMTEFVLQDSSHWGFDPMFGFPSTIQSLQPSLDTEMEEPAQTMNPQYLNYHFNLPIQTQMPFQAPAWLGSVAGNGLARAFDPGMGFNPGMQGFPKQSQFWGDAGGIGVVPAEYAMQGIAVKGLPSAAEYQHQQPAIQQQFTHQHLPVATVDSGLGLGLGLHIDSTPTPSVFRPRGYAPTAISTPAGNADRQSLLSATAALTLPDNPAASSAKPPHPSLKLGKRRFVSLRVYHDGELRFQRKVVRYGLQVCQQPTQGKTFTDKDRRPIVHPPILRLWLVNSYLVNPLMAGYAESLPELLDDDSLWLDRVMDISPVDTANYMCIVDALTPVSSTDSADSNTALSDSAGAHVPSGYRLCNTLSLPPLTASPVPLSPYHPSRVIKAEGRAYKRQQSTTNTGASASSAQMDVHKASLASVRKAAAAGTKRGSERQSDRGEGSGKGSGSGSASQRSTGIGGARQESDSSSSAGEAVSSPPKTDSSSSSFSGPIPGHGTASWNGKPSVFRIPATPLTHGSPAIVSTSTPTSPTTSSGSAAPEQAAERQKQNLFGNWAMGCRKMYGMGAADDLGIWFMFNDISIQQPGQYALRFRCFDLTEARDTSVEEEEIVVSSPHSEQDRDDVLVPGEGVTGHAGHSRGPMMVDSEDVKPNIASIHGSHSPLPPTPTTKTAKEKKDAQKDKVRALCEEISEEFTVWGGKGMPSWPAATALTGYFSR
ncbi:hypothetical protein QFC21_003441 [Naganishia friedmannii]|uniref:Uncharacterized protein n=1 Tax=Naganishia friedmannii TaxID=89922 RepID=A0ACC2VRY2_9TREE|nr:hypothetical protein QFC21_003441 [Naganishia friedmannii]